MDLGPSTDLQRRCSLQGQLHKSHKGRSLAAGGVKRHFVSRGFHVQYYEVPNGKRTGRFDLRNVLAMRPATETDALGGVEMLIGSGAASSGSKSPGPGGGGAKKVTILFPADDDNVTRKKWLGLWASAVSESALHADLKHFRDEDLAVDFDRAFWQQPPLPFSWSSPKRVVSARVQPPDQVENCKAPAIQPDAAAGAAVIPSDPSSVEEARDDAIVLEVAPEVPADTVVETEERKAEPTQDMTNREARPSAESAAERTTSAPASCDERMSAVDAAALASATDVASSTICASVALASAPAPTAVPTFHYRRNASFVIGERSPETAMNYEPVGVACPLPPDTVGVCSNHGRKYDRKGRQVTINQDRGVVTYPLAGDPELLLLAVFDGHGPEGEQVSSFCVRTLPEVLQRATHLLHSDPAEALTHAFERTDALLKTSATSSDTSGTTAAVVLIHKDVVWTACVGDSRVIIGSWPDDGTPDQVSVQPLTVDQKPNVPSEKSRLIAAGARVTDGGPEEPARVWNGPLGRMGLAMTRSIGDHNMERYGIIATPVIERHDLAPEHRAICVASDGVWEFMSNEEVMRCVASRSAESAGSHATCARDGCEAVVDASMVAWSVAEGDYRDDITAIVMLLPPTPPLPFAPDVVRQCIAVASDASAHNLAKAAIPDGDHASTPTAQAIRTSPPHAFPAEGTRMLLQREPSSAASTQPLSLVETARAAEGGASKDAHDDDALAGSTPFEIRRLSTATRAAS